MGIPMSQMWAVSKYVVSRRLLGKRRYPLVLMLEPVFRCNLSCAGCGKIQYPAHVLKKSLTAEQCLDAAHECGTPVVSIAGGEPLLLPQIGDIVTGLIAQKRYIYLCTNAILLKEKLDMFQPNKHLSFSVHLDGLESEHDEAVCREGVYAKAVEAIRAALDRGFRVTTNTTLFDNADPEQTRAFFDMATELGVEGMMISPGYNYSKAPDQDHFLKRQQTVNLFRRILHQPKKSWVFNHSPLFLQFIAGMHEDYECTPWGNPTFNVFGWQRPCYLLQEGYARSFQELMEETDWDAYGRKSGNPSCADCMVHCGFEPTAVDHTFGSWTGFATTAKAFFTGPRIPPPDPSTAVPEEPEKTMANA